jgi:broad specificity phosphatase PhoE
LKIGLLRHFKVKIVYPRKILLSHDELVRCFIEYDSADIESENVDISAVKWKKCYASTMKRAKETAETIYNGEIIFTDDLVELNVLPQLNRKLRMPLTFWAVLTWIVTRRKGSITDKLAENNEDVLIVSHGFVMSSIRKELKKRGFKGHYFQLAAHNKLYIFEN